MTTIYELYITLGKLLKTNPEISNLNMNSCGVPGTLFIYKDKPDGSIESVSYEEYSFIHDNKNTAEEYLNEMGISSLPEQYMNYLIQMCIQGAADKEIRKFIKEFADKVPADCSQIKSIPKNFFFKIEQEIILTTEDIDQIICSSLEGGEISRWCSNVEPVGELLGEFEHEQIARGGKLKFFETKKEVWHELTLDHFIHGFSLWYKGGNDIYNTVTTDGKIDMFHVDAVIGDQIIQYALFNKLIY